MKEHILIVDDDQQVTSFLERFFEKNGYRTTGVASSGELFSVLERDRADLIVLDLILPDEDGLDVARRLQRVSDLPIIMLSARSDPQDRIVGLELGADDYVSKPYEPRELLARVRTVLRRRHREVTPLGAPAQNGMKAEVIRFAEVEIDPVRAVVQRRSDGQDLNLTSTEFAILKCIVEARGEVVSRDEVLDAVYGATADISDRVIDAHMVRLRRKLGQVESHRSLIATVHGRGYRLAAEILP
ncbi:MAG: response regulator transcription factor [Pseudomonadota bacterium]